MRIGGSIFSSSTLVAFYIANAKAAAFSGEIYLMTSELWDSVELSTGESLSAIFANSSFFSLSNSCYSFCFSIVSATRLWLFSSGSPLYWSYFFLKICLHPSLLYLRSCDGQLQVSGFIVVIQLPGFLD